MSALATSMRLLRHTAAICGVALSLVLLPSLGTADQTSPHDGVLSIEQIRHEIDENAKYERRAQRALERDLAQIDHDRRQRQTIVNTQLQTDYRSANQSAYAALDTLYQNEISANNDVLNQITELRKRYRRFANLSIAVLGPEALDHYQTDTTHFLEELSLAATTANAAAQDIHFVLSDLLNERPLYIGQERMTEDISTSERSIEHEQKALFGEDAIRSDREHVMDELHNRS